MATAQDILAQYTQDASDILNAYDHPETVLPPKQAELSDASKRNINTLNNLTSADGYAAAVARRNGLVGGATEVQRDMATLTPDQLYAKYGDQAAGIIAASSAGASDHMGDVTYSRTQNEAAGDTAAEVGAAPVTALAGITGLGFDLVGTGAQSVTHMLDHAINGKPTRLSAIGDKTAQVGQDMGLVMSRGVDTVNQFMHSHESDALQAHRRANAVLSNMLSDENSRIYERDVARGDGKFTSTLRQIGRGFLDGLKTETNDPEVFGADAANAVGSLLGVGPVNRLVSKGAEALTEPGIKLAFRTGLIDAGTKVPEKLAAAGEHALTAGAVGTLEAGTAYQQTSAQVLNMSHDDLQKKSPAYNNLISQGLSPQDAQNALASEAGRIAADIAGPTGAAAGTIVSKFEGKILEAFLKGDISLARSMLAETIEEGSQGATGQLGQNVGIQQTADPNQQLGDQVGEQSAIGAIHGPGAVLATGGPARLAKGAIDTVHATGDAIKEAGSSIVDAGKSVGKAALSPIASRGQRISEMLQAAASNIPFVGRNAPAPTTVEADASPVPDQVPVSEATTASPAPVDNSVDTPKDVPPPEAVNKAIETANTAPDKVDPDLNDQILFHAEQGNLPLEPNQKSALEVSRDLVRTQQEYADNAKRLGSKANVVSNEILTGEGNSAPSAKEHVQGIVQAMNDGNVDLARSLLDDFHQFGQLMQNKVGALNDHLENGDGTSATGVTYRNLIGSIGRRAWVQSDKKMSVNPEKPNSVRFAQQVANEANAISNTVNSLVSAYPQLGIKPLEVVPLHKDLQGNINDVVAKAAKAARNTTTTKTTSEPTATTPEPEATGQPKGGDLSAEVQRESEAKAEPAPTQQEPTTRKERFKQVQEQLKSTKRGELQTVETYPDNITDRLPVEKGLHHYAYAPSNGGQTVTGKYTLDGDTIENLDIGDTKNPVELGSDEVKKMFTKLREQHPNVKTIQAFRMTGARKNAGSGPQEFWASLTDKGGMKFSKTDPRLESDQGGSSEAKSQAEEPAPVEQPKPEASPAEETAPASAEADRGTADAEPAPADEPSSIEQPASKPNSLKEAFPDLLGSKEGSRFTNWFQQAYRLPKTAITRIFGQHGGFIAIRDALKSNESLAEFIGHSTNHTITKEIAAEYQRVMSKGVQVARTMQANLQTYLDGTYQGSSRRNHLINETKLKSKDGSADVLLNEMLNGRALNITEIHGDRIDYNSDLLAGAVLAGMQWLLTSKRSQQRLTAEDVSKIINVPEGVFPSELVEKFNQGLSEVTIKRTLAKQIIRYWGVQARQDVDQAFVDGIAESIAAEVMTAMVANKLLTQSTVEVTAEEHGLTDVPKKTFNFYQPTYFKDAFAYPTAIEDAVMTHPESNNIGSPSKTVAQTVMNNPGLENSSRAKAALKHENNTPYRLHLPFVGLARALGESRIMDLLGEGDLSKRTLNINTKRSLEGKNQTLLSAFESMLGLHDEVANQAETEGKEVSEMEIFYDHNMSSVGRMQQLGKDTPQSSKLVRHAVLPTFATRDLTNGKQLSLFLVALGQSLGIKVHNQSPSKTEQDVLSKFNGELTPAVKVLQKALSSGEENELKINDKQFKALQDAFGGRTDPASLFAALEYARYLNAVAAKTENKFETPLYIEADGLTNGPIMSMMTALAGRFTPNWLHNMAMGGVFFHDTNLNTNKYREKSAADLYEKTANALKKHLGVLRHNLGGNTAAITQMDHLLHLMQTFLPKQVFTDDEGRLQFGRDVTKNPLTITLYGAGEKGIANNVANQLMGAIYDAISDALERQKANPELDFAEAMFGNKASDTRSAKDMLNQFSSSLGALTDSFVMDDQGKLKVITRTTSQDFVPEQFTLNNGEFKNLSSNLLHLFVKPMRGAISETVGPELINSLTFLRKATQVQSIFAKYEYRSRLEKLLKGSTNTRFISQEEQDRIREDMGPLDPVIRTKTGQIFYPAGSTKSDVSGDREFGRGLDEKHRTPAYIYGPDDAGVSGIPTMIIGMGDGLLQQTLATFSNTVRKALKVFDGVNLALDQAEQGSEQANKAAFFAMMSNPMREISKSYDAFMEAVNLNKIDGHDELTRALFDNDRTAKRATDNEIKSAMLQLQKDLKRAADEIDARHNVVRRMAVSIDQMAAVGSPYQHEGEFDLTGLTANQITELMNRMFDQEMNAVAEDNEASQLATDFKISGSNQNSGVTVISHNQLKRMLPRLQIHTDQLAVLRDIVNSLVTKQYQIVTGAAHLLQEYTQLNGGQQFPSEGPNGSKVNGVIAFGDKKIYITNQSPETLTHELIHAATFEKVVSFYSGNKLSEVEHDAITRLEELMNQFLTIDDVPIVANQAYNNALAAIQAALENPNLNPAMRSATALNEFMAWAQSNETLIDLLKNIKVENPLVKLAKSAVQFIKQLVWGNRRAPKVADDMHSNLRFNTSILVNSGTTMSELIGDAMAFHSEAFGSNEHLEEVNQVLQDKVLSYLEDDAGIDIQKDDERRAEFDHAGMLAHDVANTFAAQFKMTPAEKLTFEMVVTTLGTQAKLDPNSLSEVQKLYTHVTKNLRYTDFLANPEKATDKQAYYARRKLDAVLGNLNKSRDAQGRSTLLSAFLGLAITNQEFRSVLSKMEVPELKLQKWNSIDNILNNAGMTLMDKLGATVSGADRKSPNVAAAIHTLTDRIMLNAQERQSQIMDIVNGPEELLGQLNDKLVGGVRSGIEKLHDTLDAYRTPEDSKAKEVAIEFTKAVTSLLHEEKSAELQMGLMSQMNKTNVPVWLRETFGDFIGMTKENAPVLGLIKLIRSRVQQVRQQFRENLPVLLKNKFTRKLTNEEWQHLFYGLGRTDLAALASMKGMTEADMLNLVKDQSARTKLIAQLEEQISSLDQAASAKMLEKAKQLAEYMNNGDAAVFKGNMIVNAHAIAHLFGESKPGSRTASKDLVQAIDHLTTLYALHGLPEARSEVISKLVDEQSAGMQFLTSYLIGQRVGEQDKVGGRSLANHYKGYIPAEIKKGDSLRVVEDGSEDARRLTDMGFVRVGDYNGSNAERGQAKKGYYFAPVPTKAPFRQGLFQNVRHTASGVDPSTGFTNMISTAGQITDLKEVRRLTRLMHSQNQGSETLRPIYDDDGYVIAFERMIDPLQEGRVTREDNLAEAIGIWRGRQAEELTTRYFNQTVIRQTKKVWDRDKKLRSDEFINLFDPELKDRVYKDAVSLLTAETIRDIESTFGKGEFWVRKDLILDTIGARQASIGDAWTGVSRWSPETQNLVRNALMGVFGNKAYIYSTKGEKFIQDVVTDLKVSIVVKSVIVPAANLTANILQLIARGVPISRIATGMPRKTAEIDAYVKSRVRQIELEAELRASSKDVAAQARINGEIQSLKDANKRLSIWPLIDAGEFSAISDTTVTHEEFNLSEGRLAEYIEGIAQKMPKPVLQAARYGLITKDTPLFKALQRSVEYGDFLGKALLYDHLVNVKKKTVKEALATVNEEFVNYDRLAGRDRQYLESIGLIWFWNFKIRSMKVAASMIRNNPLQALFAMSIPFAGGLGFPGSPITDNLLSIWWSKKLGWSMGIGMGFQAHKLNPWINAFS